MQVMFGELIIQILLDSSQIRSSTGVGLEWFSPIGPFTFTLAQPISKIDTDKHKVFNLILVQLFKFYEKNIN